MTVININTDGGARGNPGPAAIAFVVSQDGLKMHESSQVIGRATNNEAEYLAVEKAFDWLMGVDKNHIKEINEINFFLDSLLVVNQLKGIYKIKEPRLKQFELSIKQKIKALNIKTSFSHVPRSQNARADFLLNSELDK